MSHIEIHHFMSKGADIYHNRQIRHLLTTTWKGSTGKRGVGKPRKITKAAWKVRLDVANNRDHIQYHY